MVVALLLPGELYPTQTLYLKVKIIPGLPQGLLFNLLMSEVTTFSTVLCTQVILVSSRMDSEKHEPEIGVLSLIPCLVFLNFSV